ncbi:MAG: metallophosphoesterase [Burkholderiales bacterium]
MSPVRYVCLSDLHLGADYSLMTLAGEGGGMDLSRPSRTLETFGAALRRMVPLLGDGTPPTLLLMGDVLDMGLSSMVEVSSAFQRFIEVLFPRDGPQVFSDQVICIPGNHDHHLWVRAQDRHFVERLARVAPGAAAEDMIEATSLFDPEPLPSPLLTTLMAAYPHLSAAQVRIAYPNLGLASADGRRCILLHHGHYLDATYRAMSTLNGKLTGNDALPATVAQIEAENGSWVDFLFSDLGSSGELGRDAATLYEISRDAGASHWFCEKVGDALLGGLGHAIGVGGSTKLPMGVTIENVVRGMVDATLGRAAETGRDSYATVMSTSATADLRWYLGGPLREELRRAGRLDTVAELSFIFGHTHKPFQDQLPVAGYPTPVGIYNTGGWVMDQPTMAAAQGASAIFIDEALNVATLRLFNDPVDGADTQVSVRGVGGFRDLDNPLLAALSTRLAETQPLWKEFSAAAKEAIEMHARTLLREFFDADGGDDRNPLARVTA